MTGQCRAGSGVRSSTSCGLVRAEHPSGTFSSTHKGEPRIRAERRYVAPVGEKANAKTVASRLAIAQSSVTVMSWSEGTFEHAIVGHERQTRRMAAATIQRSPSCSVSPRACPARAQSARSWAQMRTILSSGCSTVSWATRRSSWCLRSFPQPAGTALKRSSITVFKADTTGAGPMRSGRARQAG